jgi:dienelactone hydrolase
MWVYNYSISGNWICSAVRPVSAKTQITDTKGLRAGAVKIPVKDGAIPAYRAQPASGNNFPIILVIQEIFGVHEHIQDVVRRLAKLGYLAIAPELFVRQGDVSKLSSVEEIRAVVAKVYPDAPHAFFADYRPSYRETEAKNAWDLLQEWFKRQV